MKVERIASVLARLRKLGEPEARAKAEHLFAAVRAKHPLLRIKGVGVNGGETILMLKNGTRVRFHPDYPVPIWVFPEGMRRGNPYRLHRATPELVRLGLLAEILDSDHQTPEAKRDAQSEMTKILRHRGVTTIEEYIDVTSRRKRA